MRVTVLGSCGAWPEPGRACSGFLVDAGGARIALDLGYGVLPRLLAGLGSATADGLDAVVITHRHPDHVVDLHGLFRARWFGRRGAPRIPVYAAPGVRETVRALEEPGEAEDIDAVFSWHPLPASPYDVAGVRLESLALPHWVPNAGVRLTADGVTLAYTGDTGPSDALDDLGRDADLFLVEATDRPRRPGVAPVPGGPAYHLDSAQAGGAAHRAGARRLMLTHFWPGNDREVSRRAAAERYGGEVLLAEEGLTVDIAPE